MSHSTNDNILSMLSSPRVLLTLLAACSILGSACGSGGGILGKEYEYEEELYLVCRRFCADGCERLGRGARGAARRSIWIPNPDARRRPRQGPGAVPGTGCRCQVGSRVTSRRTPVRSRARRCERHAAAVACGAVLVVVVPVSAPRRRARIPAGGWSGRREGRWRCGLDRKRARRVPDAHSQRDPVSQRAVEAGASAATSSSGNSRCVERLKGVPLRGRGATWSRTRFSTRRCCCLVSTIVAGGGDVWRGDLVGRPTRSRRAAT